MIIFAIPLRSKASSQNWESVVLRFNATLESIFHQTNPNFKCIVACNNIPELTHAYDDRLEFIQLDIPTPTDWIQMSRDKFWKLTAISVRIRAILASLPNPENGIYVMPVDADDLLNRNIAQWCADHPNVHGAVSCDGYVWKEGSHWMTIYPQSHTFCGSCNIIKMYAEDLPDKMPFPDALCHDQSTAAILNARYPIRFDHHLVVAKYAEQGKPFSTLPFRSTIYLRGTGDNISSLLKDGETQVHTKRFHPIAFLRRLNPFQYKAITNRIRDEFGVLL